MIKCRTILLLLLLMPPIAAASTLIGRLAGTLAKSGSPYTVIGDVTVYAGDTLRIEPGVVVLFRNNMSFIVKGVLLSTGTATDSIAFASEATAPAEGDWNGIFFNAGSDGELAFVKIRHARVGIRCDATSPLITDCVVARNHNGVVCENNAAPRLERNAIVSNLNAGIRALDAAPQIIACTIQNNGRVGLEAAVLLQNADALVTRSIIIFNSNSGIDLVNCPAARILQNTIARNEFGITISSSNPVVTNNLIVQNSMGLLTENSELQITYNDVWENVDGDFDNVPGAIGTLSRVNARGDSVDAFFNLRENPFFISPASGDFRLQNSSPCIDTGDPGNPAQIAFLGAAPDIGATEADGILLPVELVSFAYLDGELLWITASESSNYGFYIEASAGDSLHFRQIGFVAGRGTSAGPREYRFSVSPEVAPTFYRLRQVDFNGTASYSPVVRVQNIPREISLSQNYPNPFHARLESGAATTIRFALRENAQVEITVYDVLGRVVKNLVRQQTAAGTHAVVWDGTDARGRPVAAGIYFYRMLAAGAVFQRQLIVMR